MDLPVNQIIEGHVLDVLKEMPGRAVNAIITSPPYWGLRAYNTEPVVWPCGWRGELGLEPTPELYIEHLMAVFDALKRVLRDDGVLFVNISDTYSGSGGAGGDWEKGKRAKEGKWRQPKTNSLNCQLNEVDAVWLAALIDGEGSIMIHCQKHKTRVTDSYQPEISIGMIDKAMVERAQKLTQCGSINLYRNKVWQWVVRGQQTSAILRAIYPYLLLKQNQAKVAIAVSNNTRRRKGKKWATEEDMALRIKAKQCVSSLNQRKYADLSWVPEPEKSHGIPAKSLCLIPERFVLAMQQHGWIVRCKIVWAKGVSFCETYSGSCMPDSAKDRPNKNGYEMVYMFTKKKHYWYEQQYEECSDLWQDDRPPGVLRQRLYPNSKYNKFEFRPKQHKANVRDWQEGMNIRGKEAMIKENPLGRTIRNVWCINPQAYSEAHFATYPEKLVEPLIKMAVPEQVCKKCGLGRKKIYKKGKLIVMNKRGLSGGGTKWDRKKHGDTMADEWQGKPGRCYENKLAGLTDCGCKAGWRNGVALDPFMGSGTVAVVAYELRRDYIGIELQADYVQLARRRLDEHKERYGLLER